MKIEKKKLKEFRDDRGSLVPMEIEEVIDFVPKRLFYVTGVPKGLRRGDHAHYKNKQVLVCVKGQIGVSLANKDFERYFILDENEYVYVPNFVWDAQVFLTGEDVLLVLCSTSYDEHDYIYDKSEVLDVCRKRETL